MSSGKRMWSTWSPNKFSFQTRLVCLLLPCKLFVHMCTPSKLKLSNVFFNNIIFSFCTMFFFSSYLLLVHLMLSCSHPNGYHLKCYQESKRVCQLMRLVPGCRLTRLNTSPANTNTSGFTLFLNSNDKKLRNKIDLGRFCVLQPDLMNKKKFQV